MKPVWRKTIIVALSAVGVILVLWIVAALLIWWPGYKQQLAFNEWQANLEKPYQEDTYGGKTPEETWALFLAALRKEDVELASKYFVVEEQEDRKNIFFTMKEEKKLDNLIKELNTLEKDNDNTSNNIKSYYSYKYFNEEVKKEVWSSVVFKLNSYTKVWKISVL